MNIHSVRITMLAATATLLAWSVASHAQPRWGVFEICCHKVEYVDEMLQVRARHIECRNECLAHIERGLRNAAKKGLLAPTVNPRLAAIGLHALVDGLIVNWVLDPGYLPLAKAAEPLVDSYVNGLKAGAVKKRARRR